ncbi:MULTISPECIES: nuclear transport factor 2 family protein [Rhodococcus]|uniref:Nuclear transport factor 2 family protein n=1 Tax=Rhodococcus oxybenzonivorans TaxID=1990687 RepID=A0AAE4UVV8_9NOCA|nr:MULTISPECIES: nuclear transport factor 2 family protein [Rhodococcus]MDV7243392.1 nuclear transport factor 2 family protein [Rhodococcus oxybenzonivorans]MDV7263908.1 nuclear transport factor 2 family protein [Rhodococcus oxybenzonivorans]MDV7276818.1 nuclear transport factor 2 family protein [Rhodococcus oxybenzonivorans]MDV7334348.1 nuclear transport factor 2 family protein [Rhodococcus oxybenzonivorans]MDV7344503.1 nuclear transport factor 2 family protein [Rhodococcus oxybenzonivorans]
MSCNIEKYYAAVDSGHLEDAVAMLAPDVEFAMVLPTGITRDKGREVMLGYLQGRPPVDRKHHIERVAIADDLQFAHGAVTDDGVTTGFFVGVMRIGPDGLIDRYQVSFDAEFSLLPTALTSEGA